MKGRNPNKAEKEHMSKVQHLGCIVCMNQGFYGSPAEIHHVYGKTKKDTHLKILPLCPSHHRYGGYEEPISRHPYKARFEKAYGTEQELLEQVENLLANQW
jgi:hypothetical protein